VKFVIGVLHENLSRNPSVEKIALVESQDFFEGINELMLVFSMLFDRFRRNSAQKFSMTFNDYEFDGNQVSESRSFLRSVMEFLSLISAFIL
jgi:hypothetical protein